MNLTPTQKKALLSFTRAYIACPKIVGISTLCMLQNHHLLEQEPASSTTDAIIRSFSVLRSPLRRWRLTRLGAAEKKLVTARDIRRAR